MSISGIDLLGVMYRRFPLTYKVIHGEFGAIKCLNSQYAPTPLPCQYYRGKWLEIHLFFVFWFKVIFVTIWCKNNRQIIELSRRGSSDYICDWSISLSGKFILYLEQIFNLFLVQYNQWKVFIIVVYFADILFFLFFFFCFGKCILLRWFFFPSLRFWGGYIICRKISKFYMLPNLTPQSGE